MEQITREELEQKCVDYFQIEVDDVNRTLPLITENMPGIQTEVCDNATIRLYGLKEASGLNQLLIKSGIQVYSAGFHHMDLEDYFLARMDGIRHEENGNSLAKKCQ